jgi:tetratricopeptide (TPR) repeat protein
VLKKLIIVVLVSLTAAASGVAAVDSSEKNPDKSRRSNIVDDAEPKKSQGRALPPLAVETLISRSETLLQQGGKSQNELARRLLGLASNYTPDNLSVHVGLARAEAARYARRWVGDDAVIEIVRRHARRALKIAPRSPEAHAAMATALMLSGEWADAFEEASECWSLRGDASPPWLAHVYAQALIGQARLDEAVEIIDEAIRQRPDHPAMYALKGAARLEAGDRPGAIDELEKALLLDDGLTPARILLGWIYSLMGNTTLAGNVYKNVVARAPEEEGRVLTLMAVSLISKQKYAQAMAGLNQVRFRRSIGLGQGTVLFLKATSHEGLGNDDDARKAYRKVIDEYPQASYGSYSAVNLASSSYESLARLEMKAGRMDDAARIMEEAMAGEKPNLTLFLRLSVLYEHYQLLDDALNILRRAAPINFGPRQVGPKVTLYVAWARASKKQSGNSETHRDQELLTALTQHEAALLASESLPYFLEAARAAVLAGDPEKGLTWVKRAVDLGYAKLDWITEDMEMQPISKLAGFEALLSEAGSP